MDFHIFHQKTYISPWFLCAVALLWLLEPELLLPGFFSTLVHEFGHIFALKLLHSGVSELKLSLFGATLRPERDLSYGQEIFVAGAGPVCSLVFGLICAKNRHFLLSGMSFSLGFLNLLPIHPLDGGRILSGFCALRLPPDRAGRVVQGVGKGVGGGVLLASLLLLKRGGSPALTLLSLWLLLGRTKSPD